MSLLKYVPPQFHAFYQSLKCDTSNNLPVEVECDCDSDCDVEPSETLAEQANNSHTTVVSASLSISSKLMRKRTRSSRRSSREPIEPNAFDNSTQSSKRSNMRRKRTVTSKPPYTKCLEAAASPSPKATLQVTKSIVSTPLTYISKQMQARTSRTLSSRHQTEQATFPSPLSCSTSSSYRPKQKRVHSASSKPLSKLLEAAASLPPTSNSSTSKVAKLVVSTPFSKEKRASTSSTRSSRQQTELTTFPSPLASSTPASKRPKAKRVRTPRSKPPLKQKSNQENLTPRYIRGVSSLGHCPSTKNSVRNLLPLAYIENTIERQRLGNVSTLCKFHSYYTQFILTLRMNSCRLMLTTYCKMIYLVN